VAGRRLPAVPWPITPHIEAPLAASAHSVRPDRAGQSGD
jgi:hypothetical protein